ncbi:TolC family protein [Bacteroides heparinolyticus]|uniref:Outer membrane efflux protein n=4 Tax=Prevotella heparinolytica TaxID=28113 RepID=A0A449I689_9BACE|nr:TolC family protein [Bacteroides heparinolyticus]MCI6213834.1 TolC family protein [Bacteroides heparinolyticus]TCO90010.1 outer membrane efflux protein [Bacteroides heparinolyticus]VFB14928.1 outer membrane protein [Bacteroides heparinolyticus]
MKRNRYIPFALCSITLFALLLFPSESAAQEMSREDRIKILQALKEGDAALEANTLGRIDQDVPEEINSMELPPLSVFLDAVLENAMVKSAQSQVAQQENALRLEKRNWWNYIRLNGNYSYGRFNTLNQNSDTYVDWYQATSTGTRSTFNVGASISVGLGDLINRPLKLKNYRYNIEQLKYAQEQVMEERRLKVMDAYNSVTAQLATIKAKAENAALYNAQMKISENNFVQGKIDIITLSLERARRSGAVTTYAEARVSLHNAITLLEMLTNVKIVKEK